MRRSLLLIILFSWCLTVMASEDLPKYSQQLTIEFNTEQDAQQADLTALELPPGKTLAVGARWDDTTYAHLNMTKTLVENGWKGTFFTNRIDSKYVNEVVRHLQKDGSSIGAHSMTHPHLETLPVNKMFYELLGNRVILEAATDQCVTTFTFPFGLHYDDKSLSSAKEQGEALVRTGILGGPERLGKAREMGLSDDLFLSPYLFAANDRDPNAELFAKGFQSGLNAIKQGKSDCGPYIVLGVHSWQNSVHKDGFDRLSKILATESNKPEYWYCNSNEYTAWRLAFLKNKITKKEIQGATIVYQLDRVEPAELGALLDMGLKVTPIPKKITLHDKAVSFNDKGEFMLTNDANHGLPKLIDHVDNSAVDGKNIVRSTKIPVILFSSRIDVKANKLYWKFKNESTDKTVENMRIVTRLPLKWKKGILRYTCPSVIAPGNTKEMVVELPDIEMNDKYKNGNLFIDNQCDFTMENDSLRIHGTIMIK